MRRVLGWIERNTYGFVAGPERDCYAGYCHSRAWNKKFVSELRCLGGRRNNVLHATVKAKLMAYTTRLVILEEARD